MLIILVNIVFIILHCSIFFSMCVVIHKEDQTYQLSILMFELHPFPVIF